MSPEHSQSNIAQQLHGHRSKRAHEHVDDQSTSDLFSQIITILLSFIAAAVYAIVESDGSFGLIFWAWLGSQFAAVAIGAWLVRRRASHQAGVPIVTPLIVGVGLLALVWEGGARTFLKTGLSFELLVMSLIRNLILALAVVSVWSSYQKLCVALSLFLAMFGVIASRDLAAQWLAGFFAVGAVSWLVISHWENVRRRLQGRDVTQKSRLVLLIPIVLISVVGIGLAARDRRVTTAIRGLMPSSGGDGASDPYARSGVGDGEMLVAGTNQIQSFAPIDDAPFMQDDKPSLYDLFDDTYEEEAKISKTDRAIGLPPDLASRAKEHLHTRTEKANREFSTLRQSETETQNRKARDIRSDALFYVSGRVPLHLRLNVYDLFDGISWYPEEEASFKQPLKIAQSNGKPWLDLKDRSNARDYLSEAETHALKIINLDSNTIPAPLHLHGVHIDLVDRADMFEQGPAGLIGMNRKKLPSLVPIHLATRAVDTDRFDSDSILFLRLHTESSTSVVPETINVSRLKKLAQKWSENSDGAWNQISAIVENLQRDYVLDSSWRPKENGTRPVEQFLFESQRGPDYQFATAAALLLRSLGFNTRVVSGFYADPEQYDLKSRHTPVFADDVHFWAEVRVGGADWVTIEPTPGYEVLGPPPGFIARVLGSLTLIGAWVFRNWLICGLGVIVLTFVYRNQIRLLNSLYTLRWRAVRCWAPHEQLASTLALLRKRAELSETAPTPSTTHHRWLGEIMTRTDQSEIARSLYELRRLVDTAAYSKNKTFCPIEASRVCKSCEQGCTLNWFRSESQRTRKNKEAQSNNESERMNRLESAGVTHHEH